MADPKLYRRGDIYWTRIQGRRVSTGCRDRHAALLRARELEREAADPVYAASKAISLGSAVTRTLAAIRARNVAGGTLSMYEQKLGHLVRILGADTPLTALTAASVDRYLEQRRSPDEKASDSTLGKELTAIRQVIKWARRAGLYQLAPDQVLPVGFGSGYTPRRRWLSQEQVEKLLAELPRERAAYVCFVLATGARRSELYAAQLADVDWRAGVVWLRGTKTDAADDEVPILPMLAPYLKRALKDAPGLGLPLLFPFWQNDRRDILRACERAKIPGVTWNDLRRTVGQWIRRTGQGVAPHLIGRFLRHRTSRMAELVYAPLDAHGLRGLLAEQMGPVVVAARRAGR